MTARQIAKAVCPPIIVDAARWLLRERNHNPEVRQEVSTWYEPVADWITPVDGIGQVDFKVAELDSELCVPVVRDNLGALALIPKAEATVLDLGCGNGHYKPILSAYPPTSKWSYVGVELNPALVRFCRATYPATRFELAEDGKPLPFPDDAVDVVLASGVVQYVHDVPAILAELRRVTSDYVLVSRLPTWKYGDSRIVVQHIYANGGEAHYPLHVSNREMIERVFARVGLSVIFRDYGSEVYFVPGEREPVAHIMYLFRKATKTGGR